MSSLIESLPRELLENVAVHLVADAPVGLPTVLGPLIATSRTLYSRLSHCAPDDSNAALYAQIFHLSFDSAAVRRRSHTPTSTQYLHQLQAYAKVLNAVRSGDIHRPDVEEILLQALAMLFDDDGKNRQQLEAVNIFYFAMLYLNIRFHEGRELPESNGWPVHSVANSCAMWLAWMITSEGVCILSIRLPLGSRSLSPIFTIFFFRWVWSLHFLPYPHFHHLSATAFALGTTYFHTRWRQIWHVSPCRSTTTLALPFDSQSS